jgi:ABC-2 type transport system permease protein
MNAYTLAPVSASPETASFVNQLGPLARRSVVRTLRQRAIVVPGLAFPLFFYGFNVGGLDFATRIPGFPDDSYVTFGLGLTFGISGIYATLVAGTLLGDDIKTGFIRRQSLTRLRGSAVMLSHLAGAVFFAMAQAVIFLVVGLAAGASVAAGVGGVVLIIVLAGFFALAMGSLGLMVALLTRSGEAVQGLYPALLGLMFLSSLNLPRELIKPEWFQTITTYNPISYLIEAPRSLLIEGWDAKPLGLGLLVAGAILLATLAQSAISFRAMSVRR